VVQGINATAERELIREEDTGVDGQHTAGDPPADGVSEEVNLLAGVVLGPEAHTAKQERPLVRQGSIRVAAGQLVVVPEHGPLQLEPLAQERQCLDLLLRPLAAGAVGGDRWDIFHQPDIGAGSNLFVSVDFLLLEAPFWEWRGMSPHGDFAWVVDELEVAGNALKLLVLLAVLNPHLEQAVGSAVTICVGNGDSGELLVGRVVGGGNVVGKQNSVGDQMAQPYEVVVLDVTAQLPLFLDSGKDLPLVVGIVVGISRYLLALAGDAAIVISQGVLVWMAVEVGLGFLVLDGERIVVVNRDCVGEHDVVAQRLLELGRHEIVSRPGTGEDGKVDLEPEEVEKEWHDD